MRASLKFRPLLIFLLWVFVIANGKELEEKECVEREKINLNEGICYLAKKKLEEASYTEAPTTEQESVTAPITVTSTAMTSTTVTPTSDSPVSVSSPELQVNFTSIAEARNAFEAELRCRKQGGHLAFFRTKNDFDEYLATVTVTVSSSADIWIGVQRVSGTNDFLNVDGSESYLDWHEFLGEPEEFTTFTNSKNCVSLRNISGKHKMKVADCDDSYQYSCRIDSSSEVRETQLNFA